MTGEESHMAPLGSPPGSGSEVDLEPGDRAMLTSWGEDHRADATARARRQARLAAELSAAEADLRTLLGAAHASGAVSVSTGEGCSLRGSLVEVGGDFVVLHCRRATVIVPLRAVVAVRGLRNGPPSPPVTTRTLGQVVSRLVGSDVAVIGPGTSVQGDLVTSGADHLVLACAQGEKVVLTLGGIDHLSVRASG